MVGSFAANGYGLYDMTGNVFEFCNDWLDASYYSNTPYPHVNPEGPASGTIRLRRGGGWSQNARDCRVSYRFSNFGPDFRFPFCGFRIVLDLN